METNTEFDRALAEEQLAKARAAIEEFNSAYAERYPNLRLEIVERHEVSYLREALGAGPRAQKAQILGDFSPQESAKKLVDLANRKAWVSKVSHHTVLVNSAAQPPTKQAVTFSAASAWLGWPYSRGGYRRYMKSLRALARRKGSELAMPRPVETRKEASVRSWLLFADGKRTETRHLESDLAKVKPENPLVGFEQTVELVPSKTN